MKQKVKITANQKTNGDFNFGIIIGIEFIEDNFYIGYKDEKEFLNRFTVPKYKVAYIDCVTNRACTVWFNEKEIEKK